MSDFRLARPIRLALSGLASTNAPSGFAYGAPAPPAPSLSGSIVQYITHDGDAVGNVVTSSAPNNSYWNRVLDVSWANAGGDWLDSAQTEQGPVAYGSASAITGLGQYSITVTSLVRRWRANGLNRGFFLKTRSNAFPVVFAGRTDATLSNRPQLVVVTDVGSYTLTARCNACFNSSTTNVVSSAAYWELRQGQQHAILQFDLSSIVGNISTATLRYTLTTFTQTGAIVDVFEANPPTLFDPADTLTAPTLGYAAVTNFAGVIAHGSTLIADDFATGHPTGREYSSSPTDQIAHEVSRTLDSLRNTTALRAYIGTGQNSGVNIKLPIVTAATHGGVTQAGQRRHNAYGHCRFMMESTFAGLNDRVKIPAMGAQLGWWNSAGYWQSTTGNGGTPGTGLKVVGAGGRFEYEGHSSRLTTGYRCSDTSAYSDYVRLATYIYHLDQVGGFPTENVVSGVVLKRGTWYDFDHYIQLNTMSGAQDGQDNYATANADGIYRLWVNGHQVMQKTDYRWIKNAEFSVQGFWVDVYHGGTNVSDRDMYFQINEVAVASAYIGPVGKAAVISGSNWTPNVDADGEILDTDWAQLPLMTTLNVVTNKLDDVVPTPRLATKLGNPDGSPSIVKAWCGAAIDYEDQRMYIAGGGHADSHICENGVYKLDSATLRFTMSGQRSVAAAGQYWNGTAFVPLSGASDPENESSGDPMADGRPPASHTFWMLTWIPGSIYGNTAGAFVNHYQTKHVLNLDTGVYDTPHWNSSYDNVDYSYGVALMDGFKVANVYGDYYTRVWDYAQRSSTTWSGLVGGTSVSKILYPTSQATAGGFAHGSRILRNTKTILHLPSRREYVVLGVSTESAGTPNHVRLRLGAAVDATASYSAGTSWASYFDTLTITSGDGSHTDFNTQSSWTDIGAPSAPSILFAAGCAWDSSTNTAWVWGNKPTADLYKLTGLASGNTITTERQASSARPLTTSYNGTFGRTMLITRGGAKLLVRVNSTTEYAQIVRIA